MSTPQTNQPACVFNCNCDDCNGVNPNPSQTIIGTGDTQAVSNDYLSEHFYNKEQINTIALSGGSVDLTNYYTKGASDAKYQPIGSYQPSGSYQNAGNYVSASTLNDYYDKSYVDSELITYSEFNMTLNGYQHVGDYVSASTLINYYTNQQNANIYQPIGSYVSASTLNNYFTSAQTSSLYQPIGSYQLSGNYVSATTLNLYSTTIQNDAKYQGIGNYQLSGNYVSASTLNSYYTTGQTDAKYQLNGNYVSASTLPLYLTVASAATIYQPIGSYQLSGNYVSASTLNDYSTTIQNDGKYQGIGNYVSANTLNNYYTTGQTTTLLNGYYTSGQTDSKYQVIGNYVSASTLNLYFTSAQTASYVTSALNASTVYFASGFTGTGTSGSPISLVTDLNPTINSVNPITSGGIYNALLNKQATLPTGTTAQYLAGDLSIQTFPTFGTGLTFSALSNLTNNLITGIGGGQTVVGGTGLTDVLAFKGTTANGTATSPALSFRVGNNGATTAMTVLNNGRVGIGITAPAVPLQVLSTTEQLRVSYSATKYASLTVNSAGDLSFSNNGGNAGNIYYNASAIFNFGLFTDSSTTAGNFMVPGGIYVGGSAFSGATSLFPGTTSLNYRILEGGSDNTGVIGIGGTYVGHMIASQGATKAASGVHPLFASMAINPVTILTGLGSVTNSATLYITGAASGATNNYALWSVGTTRFDVGSDATGDLHYRAASGAFTRLGVGTTGQVLGISGGLPAWVPVGYTPIATKTSGYTATINDGTILVDCTSGAVNITLPTVSTNTGQTIVIKKIDSTGNAVTVVGTVDGVTNPTITIQYNVMSIQSNGSAYYKV